MEKRKLILIIIVIFLLILTSAFLIFEKNLFKKPMPSLNKPQQESFYELNESNKSENEVQNPPVNENLNNTNKTLAGSGGGGGGSSNPVPPVQDKCIGITCNEGYLCEEGVCMVEKRICLIAQENDICDGLDITYVEGYKNECHSKYGIC